MITVLIDAGHGGIDPQTGRYTTSPSKEARHPNANFGHVKADPAMFCEGVSNRLYARALEVQLHALGVRCVRVYHDHQDTALADRAKVAKIYQQYVLGDDPCVLVSLHHNAANRAATGFEVFTTRGVTGADKIATAICEDYARAPLVGPLRADRTDGDPDKEAGFQILRECESFGIPGLLVEFGFFDNPTEAAKINSPDIRGAWSQRLAKVLAKF